jgi:hypothetical protein
MTRPLIYAPAGGGSVLPFTSTAFSYADHFLGDYGNATGASQAVLGSRWAVNGSNGWTAGSIAAPASGVIQLAAHNSVNDWIAMDWGQTSYLRRSTDGIFEWRCSLTTWTPATSQIIARIGLCDDATAGSSAAAPANEIAFILDTSAGSGGNWAIARAKGTGETVTAAATHAVAGDTSWHTFRITISGGTATFSIDGNDQGVSISSSNLPTAGLGPFVKLKTVDGNAHYLLTDYFQASGVTPTT